MCSLHRNRLLAALPPRASLWSNCQCSATTSAGTTPAGHYDHVGRVSATEMCPPNVGPFLVEGRRPKAQDEKRTGTKRDRFDRMAIDAIVIKFALVWIVLLNRFYSYDIAPMSHR